MANEVSLQYSTDLSVWTSLSPSGAWNYANGLATSGDTITTNKLSTATGKGKYHETSTLSETIAADRIHEIDFAIIPVWGHVALNTLYYFRLQIDGSTIELNAGQDYPSVELTFTDAVWDEEFDKETAAWSESCWNTAGQSWSNSCWNTAGPSWSNSCWNTAGASWAGTCWITADAGWQRDTNFSLSGQD